MTHTSYFSVTDAIKKQQQPNLREHTGGCETVSKRSENDVAWMQINDAERCASKKNTKQNKTNQPGGDRVSVLAAGPVTPLHYLPGRGGANMKCRRLAQLPGCSNGRSVSPQPSVPSSPPSVTGTPRRPPQVGTFV